MWAGGHYSDFIASSRITLQLQRLRGLGPQVLFFEKSSWAVMINYVFSLPHSVYLTFRLLMPEGMVSNTRSLLSSMVLNCMEYL